MLFDNYDTFQYQLGNRTLTLTDIFKSISFVNVESSDAFYTYYIQDGETPEMISAREYGTPIYAWLILLTNKIVDRKREWFSSNSEFEKQKEINYGGNAYYISALPDLKPGDIMVKVTATGSNGMATGITTGIYQHIASFDNNLRKIRGICGAGTFQTGDSILFARKQDNGNVLPIEFDNKALEPEPIDNTEILFKESFGQSVEYFYTENNIILNPYKVGITGSNISTYATYTDPGSTTGDNFARTVLYKYGVCGGSFGSPLENISKKSIDETVYSSYYSKQKIRILQNSYLPVVLRTIENALESNQVGNIFKIQL